MPAKVFRGDKAKELLDYAHSELNASARQKELTLEAAEARERIAAAIRLADERSQEAIEQARSAQEILARVPDRTHEGSQAEARLLCDDAAHMLQNQPVPDRSTEEERPYRDLDELQLQAKRHHFESWKGELDFWGTTHHLDPDTQKTVIVEGREPTDPVLQFEQAHTAQQA